MRILLINFEYPPLGGGGGIAMMEIAEELARRHSVHVLTSGAPGLDDVWRHPALDLTVHRASVSGRKDRATASFLSMLGFLPAGIRLGNRLVRELNFDIVNTWFAIPSGITGGRVAGKNGIPHVLTVIGGDIYDPSKWYSPHSFVPSGLAVKWALKQAGTHVAISSDIARRTKQYFKFERDIDVIPLGIRAPQFRAATRAELNLDADKRYIVTVGRLVRRKDYPTLIKALKALDRSDTELLMIGDGPEQSHLQALATELGIGEKVHFLGFVSNEMKYQVLSNSDLFVLASLHEGFGVVYLEAMYCGLPIIAADEGGQVDILEDGTTGSLVKAGNVQQMHAAMQKMLDDPDRLSAVSDSNRERFKNYSIARVAERYERVFENVLSGETARSVGASV